MTKHASIACRQEADFVGRRTKHEKKSEKMKIRKSRNQGQKNVVVVIM